MIHSEGYNKKDIIPSIGNDVDKLETSLTAVGDVKWGVAFGKQSGSWFQRLSIELPYDPRIPLLGKYPRTMTTHIHIET